MSSHITKSSIPKLIELIKPPTARQNTGFPRLCMEQLMKENKLLSHTTMTPRNVGIIGGERSYMMLGSLAKLQRALTKWSMNELVTKHKFTPVIVPNIVYDHIIERCGFPTKSQRSQVYSISGNNEESILDFEKASAAHNDKNPKACIAGTSEFALVSIRIGDNIPSDELPLRYCALSRCYRAETSSTSSEKGLYRVHYFDKVEMVGLSMPNKGLELHEEFLAIQRDLFSQLELEFQILDMPDDDLGQSAVKKYDIEAWMNARQRYGEISSTSYCEDRQSAPLNIKYSQMIERDNQLHIESGFVHTVNGTACSTIRTIIALIEQHQTQDGRVILPKVLHPYMNGITELPTRDDEKLLKDVELCPER